jgi:hypothetical protein
MSGPLRLAERLEKTFAADELRLYRSRGMNSKGGSHDRKLES